MTVRRFLKFLLIMLLIAGSVLSWQWFNQPTNSEANDTTTKPVVAEPAVVPLIPLGAFQPQHIDFDQPEIPNPGRGLYRWRGQTMMCPADLRSDRDAYDRWNWRELEPRAGEYDWSAIHQFLDEAERRGQRAWIGIGTSTGPAKDGPYLPDDMMQSGWGDYFEGEWYPNYANPDVRTRLEQLLDAFVAEFGGDQRIIAVQMRSYGRYGEGYLPWNAPKTHVMWANDETARWLVDAWHSRLAPTMQLAAFVSDNPVFRYAMTKRPYWALNRDALGMPHQMANIDKLMQSNDIIDGFNIGEEVRERWKYAPVFTEMIGESGDLDYSVQFEAALTQVISYHVSYVGNGNFAQPYKDSPWNFWQSTSDCPPQASNWTPNDTAQFVLAGKRSGYRYFISNLALNLDQSARQLHVTTSWNNEGVAPVYEPWRVRFELRHVANPDRIAWQEYSEVNLYSILPTTRVEPFTVDDVFQLPSDLAAGNYELKVFIPALNPYVQPLRLAIDGQQADGSYHIGTISLP